MFKRIALVIAFIVITLSLHAQDIIKPSIMIIPDAKWCIKKGYVSEGNVVDYNKALLDRDYIDVLTELENVISSQYELVNLSAKLGMIDNIDALRLSYVSSTGEQIKMDDLDVLFSLVADADISIGVSVEKNTRGPMVSYSMMFNAIDVATLKTLHADSFTTPQRSRGTGLKEMLAHSGVVHQFSARIQDLFNNMLNNGRECRFIFNIAQGSDFTFFSTVNVENSKVILSEYINQWFEENAVSTGFHCKKSDNEMSFSSVMIPLMGKSAFRSVKAIDARTFVANLSSMLEPLGIKAEIFPLGIGKAYIMLSNSR